MKKPIVTPEDLVAVTRRNHTRDRSITKSFRLSDRVIADGFVDTAAAGALRSAFPETRGQIVVTHGPDWVSVRLVPVDRPASC